MGNQVFVQGPKVGGRRVDRLRTAFWPFRVPAYRDWGLYACLLLGVLVGFQSVSQGVSDGDPMWFLPVWGFVWPVFAFLGAARLLSAVRRDDETTNT
jgi:hypothetical protein